MVDVDPEKLVHDARAEDRRERTVGHSYIFDRRGEYVGETVVDLSGGDGTELGLRLKADTGSGEEWTEFLSGQEVVDTGTNEDPAFEEQVLGYVDHEEVDSYRENRWVELEDDNYEVYIENIGAEAPGVLGMRGDRPADDFVDAAASYAADLAYVDLDGEEDAWRDVLKNSMHEASERRKEVLQRR